MRIIKTEASECTARVPDLNELLLGTKSDIFKAIDIVVGDNDLRGQKLFSYADIVADAVGFLLAEGSLFTAVFIIDGSKIFKKLSVYYISYRTE